MTKPAIIFCLDTPSKIYRDVYNNERFILRAKMSKQTLRRRSLHIGKTHDQHLEAFCRGISAC